jgi:hypothetical protein
VAGTAEGAPAVLQRWLPRGGAEMRHDRLGDFLGGPQTELTTRDLY